MVSPLAPVRVRVITIVERPDPICTVCQVQPDTFFTRVRVPGSADPLQPRRSGRAAGHRPVADRGATLREPEVDGRRARGRGGLGLRRGPVRGHRAVAVEAQRRDRQVARELAAVVGPLAQVVGGEDRGGDDAHDHRPDERADEELGQAVRDPRRASVGGVCGTGSPDHREAFANSTVAIGAPCCVMVNASSWRPFAFCVPVQADVPFHQVTAMERV